jgi:hypothetical protein
MESPALTYQTKIVNETNSLIAGIGNHDYSQRLDPLAQIGQVAAISRAFIDHWNAPGMSNSGFL